MQVSRVANFINRSRTIQATLKHINKNPAMYNAIAAFTLASVMRPTLIGCFNFKDKKDKKYSQASSIAAGLVELAATAAIFLPLNKSICSASKILYNSSNTIYKNNPIPLRQFKSVTNRVIKAATLIPISLARFALVKPIVDIIFKDKK